MSFWFGERLGSTPACTATTSCTPLQPCHSEHWLLLLSLPVAHNLDMCPDPCCRCGYMLLIWPAACAAVGGHGRHWRSTQQTPAALCCPTSGWTPAPPATPGGTRRSGSWSRQVRKAGRREVRMGVASSGTQWAAHSRVLLPCAELSGRSSAVGELHNNSRMYWGKAFLQWSPSPQAALR
jgi:hypothetical protein